MDLRAFAMHMMAAASPEEPAANQPLSPVQLSPDARRQAAALLATRVPRVRVTNAYWRKPRRSAARRRADLDEQSGGYDAWEYPPDAQQDTHQERIEKADANWRRTLPQRQSQRLASAQRHDAIRAAAKQAVLASVQADIDNVVHTDACCHIGQHFSQQQGHQGRLLQQGGTQEQEQLQQQNSEGACSCCCNGSEESGQGCALCGPRRDRRRGAAAQLRLHVLRCLERDARGCGMRPSHAHAAADHLCRPAALVLPPPDDWGLSSVSNSLLCCSQQDERQASGRQKLPASLSAVAACCAPARGPR